MIRHTFLIIFRNFRRFKTTFFINLLGLATGLACSLLIYLWVQDELGMDKFHENDARLYQMMEHQQHTGDIRVTDSTPWLLAQALDDEIPEVELAVVATPTYWFGGETLSVDEKPVKASGKYASRDFFRMFSYRLLEGDAVAVLADKSSIVISEDLARSLFGNTSNVLGQTVVYKQDQTFKVSGVFENLPDNSSEYFDFVLPVSLLTDSQPQVTNWGNSGPNTFVLLRDGVDVKEFGEKVSRFIETKTPDKHRKLLTVRYSDGYLFGTYRNGVQSGGRIDYVVLFSIVAVFIMIIACINFMNLSTAKATRRIREVGIKKVAGAGRATLIRQYLVESMLMAFLSMALALLMVDLLLPEFNELTDKSLRIVPDARLISALTGIVLFTGFVAGSYPALYLSGFSPAAVLRGRLDAPFGEAWARKGLVIFQFTLSVILIVSVFVVYRQTAFVQQKNLGYDKDNVIYFAREGKIKPDLAAFLEELNRIPGVVQATSVAQSMVGGGNTTEIEWDGKEPNQKVPFAVRPVNYDVIELLDLKMVEGRSFSRQFVTDTSAVIFNEAGIEAMGLKDPIGQVVRVGPFQLHIIGVVQDFHFESLHTEVMPLFFALKPQYTETIMAKIAEGQESKTLARIGEFYRDFNPGFPFDYRFLDQDYQALYGAEMRVSVLSRYFATIAIFISCMGLFGLAAFTAERRRKEIGIRKVLGSSEMGIIYLLSGDFTRLVLISIVLAIPPSFFLAKLWLQGFAFRIPLEWWYFAGAGILAVLVAWLTVGTQAVRAARLNPTHCLRDE